MMPPPPMPNRPARMPVTIPPRMIASTSQTISPRETPRNINCTARFEARRPSRELGGDVRQIRPAVHHERQRSGEDVRAGAGLHRFGREMAAEGACAGHAAEKAEHVAGDGGEPGAAFELAL